MGILLDRVILNWKKGGKKGIFEGKELGPFLTRYYESTIIWTQCCGRDEQIKRNKYLTSPSVVV